MSKVYYTYHIRVANHSLVQVEKRGSQHQFLGKPSGRFRYSENLTPEILELLRLSSHNQLNDSGKARLLGEALFNLLFDDVLRQDFVNFYYEVQQRKHLLRVELDIDEQNMSEVAALPWEFMCLPQSANLGTIWLGTTPDIVFSRHRSQWTPAQPITLSQNEKLKIALVVSAPSNLGNVEYKRVQEALEKLAQEQAQWIELLPVVNQANPEAVDEILTQEPHIFHFIGHGRLENANQQEVGEIAFVDDFGEVMWVDAGYFSQLLNRHRPGVVILQACEGGKLSASQAFVGVASRVVQQNIPVVIAMQYEVSNATASRFAQSFYKQLAQRAPVDIAVQEGRYAIALGSSQYRKRDFAAPVIFMRVQDGYLFSSKAAKTSSEMVAEKSDTKATGFVSQPKFKLFEDDLHADSQVENFTFDVATVEVKKELFRQPKIIITRRRHQAQYFTEKLPNNVTLDMVAIPGGAFIMGAPETEEQSSDSERPQHQVTVAPFFMGKYTVTQAQWRAVATLPQVNRELKSDPSYFKGDDLPVETIFWYEAVEFCDRLSKYTEKNYRLPSEAEWEYACRAGTTTPFHFGETITPELANYNGNYTYGSGSKGEYRGKTTPVGSFQIANDFGLFDMHGNVWEWCADNWHNNYNGAPSYGNSWLNGNDNRFSLRGGSWYSLPVDCRSAYRYYSSNAYNNIGFRVVVAGARTL